MAGREKDQAYNQGLVHLEEKLEWLETELKRGGKSSQNKFNEWKLSECSIRSIPSEENDWLKGVNKVRVFFPKLNEADIDAQPYRLQIQSQVPKAANSCHKFTTRKLFRV